MLKKIVKIASSRWTKSAIATFWLLSMLLMIERGWVWESWKVVPEGIEHRTNYFEIHRTALFVWLTLILLGYLAYYFKRRSLGYYGIIEVFVGIAGGFTAISKLTLDTPALWFALAASAYVVVRGTGNVGDAVNKNGQ
jgi:hypothetical protein